MDSKELNNEIEGGIDLSRLINKDYLTSLGDFYKCSICSKIMINPTDCESCGHSFCNECISKSKCPFDCKAKNLKPASNGITNLLNNLKFKCNNEGCEEVINYIDIKSHEKLCPFQKMICPNKECGQQVIKKDLENHIKNECKYTMIKCDNCGYQFPKYQMPEHEKMCNLAFQSFNSSNSNILNTSGNNINNINNNDNKNQNNETNNFIKTLSVNIEKVLKEKNVQNEDNTNNNIINENEIKNEEIIKSNTLPIKDNVKEISESEKTNKNIFDRENQEEKNNLNNNNNIFNNDNQNDSMDNNNNELSRFSLKQSGGQGEDDDLIDILKKAVEEKLNERFVNFDSNIEKILKDIKTIKTFVCGANTDGINNINDKVDEKNLDMKLNSIKEYLKEIVTKTENEINNSIKGLNQEINKEIENNKKSINELKDINIIKKDENEKESANKTTMNEINKKIEEITNKILDSIKNTNNEINNINIKFKEELNKIANELEEKENKNRKTNIEGIETKLNDILGKNNKEQNDNIIEIFEEKINNINNIYLSNEKNKNDEINNNINDKFQIMNKDINNVNSELQTIKTNLKQISDTITEQFTEIINSLKNHNVKDSKAKVININKTFIKDNINDFSFKNNEEKIESTTKLKKVNNKENINETINTNLNIKPILNEKLNKNLQINISNDDSNNSIIKEDIIENNQDNNKIINILSVLESKLDLIDTYAKDLPNIIKDKIGNNLENNILEIGNKITEDIDKKIDSMFGIKYCTECDKVDYFYAFMKCSICSKYNCKNCISICSGCKKLICKKCCFCPVCKNMFCLNCRINCEVCQNKFCKLCILKCSTCNKSICPDCLKKCKICQKLNCINCASNCSICNKSLCNNCNVSKNKGNFIKCEICENSVCEECAINCHFCNSKVCKKCYTRCNLCDKNICFNCTKKCGNCEQVFCLKCSSDFEKTKCISCNKCFCYNCISNILMCKNCENYICKNCFIKCPQCNSILCKNENTCIKACSNCENKLCSKCCQYKCICGMFNFCRKCLFLNIELSPHQCTKFFGQGIGGMSNDASNTNFSKKRSLVKIKSNFEAKFFLEKKSTKGRTLIGLTDMLDNILENEEGNVWTLVIGSGEKYSSEKKLEKFLNNDVNEGDTIYIMKKNEKLFFRINNDEYKMAYELKNDIDYFIYIENTNTKHGSIIRFVYIRNIEEDKEEKK